MTGASLNRGGSRQDYETPADFIAAVEQRFGVIDMDLAATKENTKGSIWIDIARDSLTVDWHTLKGNLWLNPPFGGIGPWAAKCDHEARLGAKILFLTPASVGSNWFAKHVFHRAHVLFLNQRLQFVGASDSYPKDCMLSCYNFYGADFEIWRWKTTTKNERTTT